MRTDDPGPNANTIDSGVTSIKAISFGISGTRPRQTNASPKLAHLEAECRGLKRMSMFPRENMPHPALVRSVADLHRAVFPRGNIRSAA
jgi:hypothetical protein